MMIPISYKVWLLFFFTTIGTRTTACYIRRASAPSVTNRQGKDAHVQRALTLNYKNDFWRAIAPSIHNTQDKAVHSIKRAHTLDVLLINNNDNDAIDAIIIVTDNNKGTDAAVATSNAAALQSVNNSCGLKHENFVYKRFNGCMVITLSLDPPWNPPWNILSCGCTRQLGSPWNVDTFAWYESNGKKVLPQVGSRMPITPTDYARTQRFNKMPFSLVLRSTDLKGSTHKFLLSYTAKFAHKFTKNGNDPSCGFFAGSESSKKSPTDRAAAQQQSISVPSVQRVNFALTTLQYDDVRLQMVGSGAASHSASTQPSSLGSKAIPLELALTLLSKEAQVVINLGLLLHPS